MAIGGKLGLGLTQFPAIRDNNHTIKSLQDSKYNCIAYAANRTDKWWWPNTQGLPQGKDDYWPKDAPNKDTVEAFILAYKSIGYIPCLDGSLQAENEKIAIYAISGVVKHAARQLPNGMWVSKLGKYFDIEHELNALNGSHYGMPAQFMIRHYVICALYGCS
jgi:hypothetical protein